ncbi:tRNA 2-thiouridine(34) synthase MnmA [Candidatus Kaiserbacteria bacterium RIFCSPHIGHO2_01_FULL_48_10]|uniref:tRNA-specific 2-thiouridylase MnmA n=1 Tax=Candidatus Kaiserbacteria bacterium RIFCSPHIGHO2_01_FULL_48_10 TaxID=1798476 RepID=A0A1F6C1F2_9BACT|nr:MAG: tRNA 2-thiouridine(34) synthase MnmA [Candidatus Kaiserbacteria bacterium RIFCSPHIGHO2_01_FULL_48_10]
MQTVFVGLSGGVDSAVSAYLLKKEGYRVMGVFIKGWEPDFLPCTGAEDRLSAMRVAAHLEIPFVTYDFEEEYKKNVVDYFVSEYKAGRTPNPDVMCNRVIKFGAFWKRAQTEGADMIATGHYAQIKHRTQNIELGTSRDSEKDQTYFLWTLTHNDLAHTLFPVGGFNKSDVRALAREARLPNAERKDSQGLCFLGHVDMRAFLKRYLPTTVGPIYDSGGTKIGEHEGMWFYTIGEHIPLGGLEKRHYIVGKDAQNNSLVVSEKPLGEKPGKEFAIQGVNWISKEAPRGMVYGRYRYRQQLLSVSVLGTKAIFNEPQLMASGQSLVFYDEKGEICLGGAIIG